MQIFEFMNMRKAAEQMIKPKSEDPMRRGPKKQIIESIPSFSQNVSFILFRQVKILLAWAVLPKLVAHRFRISLSLLNLQDFLKMMKKIRSWRENLQAKTLRPERRRSKPTLRNTVSKRKLRTETATKKSDYDWFNVFKISISRQCSKDYSQYIIVNLIMTHKQGTLHHRELLFFS